MVTTEEPREWLIRKGGYFYRTDSCGYTTRKTEAGRYTKSRAEAEASIEPWHMSAVHESEVPDEPAVANLQEALAEAEAKVNELRELFKLDGEQHAAHIKSLTEAHANRVRKYSDRVMELRAERDELLVALKKLVAPHDEPCRRDHHGYCQTHFLEEDCCVAEARSLIERIKGGRNADG